MFDEEVLQLSHVTSLNMHFMLTRVNISVETNRVSRVVCKVLRVVNKSTSNCSKRDLFDMKSTFHLRFGTLF